MSVAGRPRRPSLARLLDQPEIRLPEFEYDPVLQMSVDAQGRPVMIPGRREVETFAEADTDRPKPRTGTNAGRDTDVDVAAPNLSGYTSTRAGRDTDDPSEPIIVTEANLDPDAVIRWTRHAAEARTRTEARRDEGDPSEPIIVTKADIDPDAANRWAIQMIAAHTSTRTSRDSDDPTEPVIGTKGVCFVSSAQAQERCIFVIDTGSLSAVDTWTGSGWSRRYDDGQEITIPTTTLAPVPFAVGR